MLKFSLCVTKAEFVESTYLQISSPFQYTGARALGFVGYDCGTNFYLLFSPSSAHVRALSQLLL
jgi:hypothetical protein